VHLVITNFHGMESQDVLINHYALYLWQHSGHVAECACIYMHNRSIDSQHHMPVNWHAIFMCCPSTPRNSERNRENVYACVYAHGCFCKCAQHFATIPDCVFITALDTTFEHTLFVLVRKCSFVCVG